jgi:hypothetical protein
MWDDEVRPRTRPRAELESQPLPLRSDLALVRSRGRRRTRQITAVIAVVAAIAGIGVGVATMRQVLARAPGGFAAAGSTSPPIPTTAVQLAGVQWPRVDLPARTPDRTWSPGWTAPAAPGRTILNTPLCDPGNPAIVPNSPASAAVRQRVRAA